MSSSALSSSRHVRISSREKSGNTNSVSEDRESSSSKRIRNVRSSAWRPPAAKSQFARNPPTFIEYTFKRYEVKVEGTGVTFWMPPNAPAEKILVGSDWKAGLSIKNSKTTQNTMQEVYKTSFVGQGSAKNDVYARIGNEEYALGQSQDIALPTTENARMLRAELTNMYIGEVIRKEFLQCASDCDVNIPDFRFNLEGAILGVLEPLEAGHISASLGLPFQDFIATRYLPCSPVDKAIQKFTGNADCGNPPDHGDSLTAAIHAFTHFTLLYTGNGLVFCDLQGLFNREGIMMLIDPQSHSAESDSTHRMYWDGGAPAIQHFLSHHLKNCEDNYICNKIEMKDLEFDWDRPETPVDMSGGIAGNDDMGFESDNPRIRQRSRSLTQSPQRRKKNKINQLVLK
ncbi:kinase-like domain-containing protein, partial [Mycena leptocephala]